jgi:hypothetical protein
MLNLYDPPRQVEIVDMFEEPSFVRTMSDGRQVVLTQAVLRLTDDDLGSQSLNLGVYGFGIGHQKYVGNFQYVRRSIEQHKSEIDLSCWHWFEQFLSMGPAEPKAARPRGDCFG